jgi:hypothetical protein
MTTTNAKFSEHPKAKYWNYELNDPVKPEDIPMRTKTKFWFHCSKCNHDFDANTSNIVGLGRWCPYCAVPSKKHCPDDKCEFCFNKSFASHSKAKYLHKTKNGDFNPLFIGLNSNKPYWFNCPDCEHDILMTLDSVVHGRWCYYCSHNQLCSENECDFCFQNSFASHTNSKYWNKEKNGDKKPRNIAKFHHEKCWFTCESGHEFQSNPAHVSRGRWCPHCKYKTEKKLYDWLNLLFPNDVKHEQTFEWTRNICGSPNKRLYDYRIVSKHVIIELDGRQHFVQVSNWETPERQREIDDEKDRLAIQNGYTIIRICQDIVFRDLENWGEKLKNILDNIPIVPQRFTVGSIYEE